jgi:putative acetyltransferase
MDIEIDNPTRPDVMELLGEHLADMYATSPPESVHALDVEALTAPGVTFWTARRDGVLVGCGALKELDPDHGELKSMRTTAAARGTGVGKALLVYLVAEGRSRGYSRLSLETGTQEYFAPARGLYAGQGFTGCGPYADYAEDPHSAYFTLVL